MFLNFPFRTLPNIYTLPTTQEEQELHYDVLCIVEPSKQQFKKNTPSSKIKSYDFADHFQYGLRSTVFLTCTYAITRPWLQAIGFSRNFTHFRTSGNGFWFGDSTQTSTKYIMTESHCCSRFLRYSILHGKYVECSRWYPAIRKYELINIRAQPFIHKSNLEWNEETEEYNNLVPKQSFTCDVGVYDGELALLTADKYSSKVFLEPVNEKEFERVNEQKGLVGICSKPVFEWPIEPRFWKYNPKTTNLKDKLIVPSEMRDYYDINEDVPLHSPDSFCVSIGMFEKADKGRFLVKATTIPSTLGSPVISTILPPNKAIGVVGGEFSNKRRGDIGYCGTLPVVGRRMLNAIRRVKI